MTVYVGEITSEVSVSSPGPPDGGSEGGTVDEWEERAQLAAMLERLERDRYRTTTGYGDD